MNIIMLKDTEKEKIKALIDEKKKGNKPHKEKQDIYQAFKGQTRKGIKQQKQGGLFDK